MKTFRNFVLLLGLMVAAVAAYSQGYSLKFSAALKISDSMTTVPSGKVWKVTSLYGNDRICVPCIYNEHYSTSSCTGRYIDFVGASFYVDGVEVLTSRNWASEFSTTDQIFSNSTCTTIYTTLTIANYALWRLYEVQPDPNMLPLWLSAGTTLKTSTPNIFLSVLEFDIIP